MWGLPGGEIDAGEPPAHAAIREVREETGLDIRLTRLIGLYSMPQWIVMNSTIAVFAANISGGTLKADPVETIDIGFFTEDQLPRRLMWWHGQRIADAFKRIGGSAVWTQDAPWPKDIESRQDLYALQQGSGLSRYDFFQMISREGPETIDIEGNIVDNPRGAL